MNENQTTGTSTTYDGRGNLIPSITFTFEFMETVNNAVGKSYTIKPFTVKSNADGQLSVVLVRNAKYRMKCGDGQWVTFTTPADKDTFELPETYS